MVKIFACIFSTELHRICPEPDSCHGAEAGLVGVKVQGLLDVGGGAAQGSGD